MTRNEDFILRCRTLIGEQLGWGDPAGWTNEDFEQLSEKIFDRTEVQLSVSTLKRIWGKVRYESSPTTGTLNALARFAGFTHWREFVQKEEETDRLSAAARPQADASPLSESSASIPQAAQQTASRPQVAPQSTLPRRKTAWVWALLGILVAAALFSFFSTRTGRKQPADLSAVRFETKKVGDDLPNSVVFHYDVRSLHAKKVVIQQNWDTTRREVIDPNSTEHTSLYLYPGHFNARLIVDGETVKKSEVFIRTKGWKGIIEGKPQPIYLGREEIRGDGRGMRVAADLLKEKTGKTLFNELILDLSNVRDFPQIAADHFTLKTSLRNLSTVEQCLSRRLRVVVLGMGTAIMIPLADKGSISNIGVFSGYTYISGKDHDLSAFGCDFNQFQDLVCTVADGHLKISLNGKQIMDIPHPKSIGQIKGIRVEFEGAGEIREMKIAGAATQLDLLDPKQAEE